VTFVLGLTGSFGSGKTTVAASLAEMGGAVVIDADAVARDAVRAGSPLLPEIARRFGADLIDAAGELNRRELAARAFVDRATAARLNAIIHPWVRARELELLERHRDAPLVVLDVPLLYEAGMQTLCNAVAVVTIREAERFARLRRRGFCEADVMRRLAHQWPQARKAARAEFVIENSGTQEATRTQVQTLLDQIHGVKPTRP
jgi:dephospho-CoA kinase